MIQDTDDVTTLLRAELTAQERGEEGPASVLDAVSWLSSPPELHAFLTAVASSPAAAAAAALSYHHPLGFDRLTLIDASPVFILRLHAWWPNAERGIEHIHDHRFSFATSIVYGGYDMQVYAHDDAGDEMNEYREGNVGESLDWRLDRLGPARLRLTATTRLAQGGGYVLASDTLHRVVVAGDAACATLFLETATVKATTTVLAEPRIPAPRLTPKTPFSLSAYQALLQAVMDRLPSLTT